MNGDSMWRCWPTRVTPISRHILGLQNTSFLMMFDVHLHTLHPRALKQAKTWCLTVRVTNFLRFSLCPWVVSKATSNKGHPKSAKHRNNTTSPAAARRTDGQTFHRPRTWTAIQSSETKQRSKSVIVEAYTGGLLSIHEYTGWQGLQYIICCKFLKVESKQKHGLNPEDDPKSNDGLRSQILKAKPSRSKCQNQKQFSGHHVFWVTSSWTHFDKWCNQLSSSNTVQMVSRCIKVPIQSLNQRQLSRYNIPFSTVSIPCPRLNLTNLSYHGPP